MAFLLAGLRRKAHGGVLDTAGDKPISDWSYKTADAAATVEGAGYFDSAYPYLSKGDTIAAVMAVGGTPVLKHYVVTASSSSGVTVALQTTTAG